MNKTALKSFAIRVRISLHEEVRESARKLGILRDGKTDPQSMAAEALTQQERNALPHLLEQIRCKGYDPVMENGAYLWFSHLIAVRFLEVNGFLPTDGGESVFASDDSTVLMAQCKMLSRRWPRMFEAIEPWAELLFPGSRVCGMFCDLRQEALKEVEAIGWLYQFYTCEKREKVIDPLHGKVISKEDIPAATQVFTPRWVVQYLLDNSLGRYWLERNPESTLGNRLTYLVTPKEGSLPGMDDPIAPQELKILDPCVGAGHFLSYAFDLLLEIYRERGWSDQEAAGSILKHNLYGLDIDDPVVRLARFAVTVKAAKYDPGLLNEEPELQIFSMQDSDRITDDFIHRFAGNDRELSAALQTLRTVFDNAKEFGSTLSIPSLNYAPIYEKLGEFSAEDPAVKQLRQLVQQAQVLAGSYDIVATNPPYLNKYSPRLKAYLKRHFPQGRADLFSVFMLRNLGFCKERGYCGFMTPMVWMFLKTYEELRRYLLTQKSITTLIQFAYSAFEEATVPICAFVLNNAARKQKALCFRLSAFPGGMELQKQKILQALGNRDCGYFYETDPSGFSVIPTSPVAFWLSDRFLAAFENKTLEQIAKPRQGLATGCNERFVRCWHEVEDSRICYDAGSTEEAKQSRKKWFPYNKGGEFRKWYGNDGYLVNWEEDGAQIRNFRNEKGQLRSRPQNTQFYFRQSVSWSLISSGAVAFRYKPRGQIFDVAGMSFFAREHLLYLLGLCNSPVVLEALAVLAPTINFQAGDIANVPVVLDSRQLPTVERIVEENIEISRSDWDAFETSWDFKKHPLI